MKQTAVEWLEERLTISFGEDINSLKGFFVIAKEMEKQQIIEAGNTCALLQHIHIDKVNQMSIEEVEKLAEKDVVTFGEQYYNENYNKE
jgi:uncharacterized protein YdbL (DUF1318 family)